ncbi:hypothetical protein C8Q72DRAFT_927570, partial [Fomitopsis betulina]
GALYCSTRRAAILAGLVPDTAAGKAKIHFVTEGEASFHFCVVSGLAVENLQEGKHIMIVDAGGGTVDLSAYKVVETSPLNVVESSPAICLMMGSMFVNTRARKFLKNTRFGNDECIDSMLQGFESSAKPTFRDVAKTSYIKFGSLKDTDDKFGIKRGVLSLAGSEMAHFFRPSIDAIKKAIQEQLALSDSAACDTVILLVGGFASNPYLRSQLHEYAEQNTLSLFFPEHHTAKAVAEGALWYHLDHFFSARRAKYVYGTDCITKHCAILQDHVARRHKAFTHVDGELYICDAFSSIIPKGTLVTEEQEFRSTFSRARSTSPRDITIIEKIMSYSGTKRYPRWVDEESDKFSTLCRVTATLPTTIYRKQQGLHGYYFEAKFDVVLLFGLTELKAQLSWKENGKECRAPAVVVYDEDDDSAG